MDKQQFIAAMAAERSVGAFGSNYRISLLSQEDLIRVSLPEVQYGEDVVVYTYTLSDGVVVIIVPADAGRLIEGAVLLV
jgi:hypothetical protein